MNPSTIAAILRTKPPDIDEATWIARELSRVVRICAGLRMERSKLARLVAEFNRTEEAFNRETAVIRERIGKVQGSCPHYSVTRHGDPAGGSDSWNECEDCGVEL